MDYFQFKLVALLTIYCNLFDMKQKIKNKFVSKSATCKIVFELGTKPATIQVQASQFCKAANEGS